MTWNLLASTAAVGVSNTTTSAINCTGADLLVVGVDSFAAGTGFSDNSGNTWTQIGSFASGNAKFCSIFYALAPIVSSAQTFKTSGANIFSGINVTAWSGFAGGGLQDQTNHAVAATATTLSAGSITPTQNNSLIILGLGTDAAVSNLAISTGTIQLNSVFNGASNEGIALAYVLQSTAAAINPAWTWTTSANAVAIAASFAPTPPTTVTKTKTVFATTEVIAQMAGLTTSPAILTEGLPFSTVELSQASGTSISSVQVQQSNDNATWVNLGSPLSVPTVQNLYTGTAPSKFVRFTTIGGDATSVINIMLELSGSRG